MKQILLILSLLMATTASAQVAELQGNKTVSVGDEVMTMDQIVPETQWYAVYQQRGNGGYWWAATPEHNASKNYAENTVCMSIGTEVLDNMPIASTVAANLVRFLPTDTEGTFTVQFGNGTYMMSAAHASVVKYTTDIAEAAQVRMYNIVTTGEDGSEVVYEGHWGFNFADNDTRIDNNGQGNSVATWESGIITTVGGNNDHQIYAIEIGEVTELEVARNEAIVVFNEYMQYYGTFVDVELGVPGHYSAEAVAAFEAAMEEGAILEDLADGEWNVEQYQTLTQRILDTYQAVLDSRIPFATEVAEGYYLIQTAPFFYYTTGGTEETVDPETGETIPGEPGEMVYLSKGLRGAVSGDNVFAAWGTYNEFAADRATFLWKVTQKGDKEYELRNMGYDVNAAYWTSSNNLLLNEGDSTVVFDYNPYMDEEGNRYYNIRPSQNAERDYFYIHCNNHGGGAGTADWIVKWAASDGSTAGASEWKLIPVSEEEAKAMIAEFAPVKDAEARLAAAQNMLADVEPKLTEAQEEEYTLGQAQITDVAQLSSPYTCDPAMEPGSGLDKLLDGDASTFWHSDWSGGALESGIHYLQVELVNNIEAAVFTFTRRAVDNDHVTVWSVYGTNDREAEKDACTLLATIVTPLGSNNETLTSSVFPVGDYQYLRFYGDEMAPNTRGYWHLAEFQLYEATLLGNETIADKMGEVFTNMQAAVDKAKAEANTISVETFNELQAAYEAFIPLYNELKESGSEGEGGGNEGGNVTATEVAEGYYLIQTAPLFYYNTGTTVNPETNETVPGETVYLSKGLRGAVSGGNVLAAWGTYDATAADRATYLWKVTSKGDKEYQLRNMGYEVNAASWNSTNNLCLNDVESTVVFDSNSYTDEAGNNYYNIRLSDTPAQENYYIHCDAHYEGAGSEGWIVKWYASVGPASEWKLVPVSEEEAAAMIADFAPVKDAVVRLTAAQNILADVEPKLAEAQEEDYTLGQAQITDVAQLSSPYTEANEGSLAELLDGNAETYWQSQWSGDPVEPGTHYLQVELADSIKIEAAVFTFTRRPGANNDHVTKWSVYGTNDFEAEKDSCTLLATIDTPHGGGGESLTSRAFPVGDYRYLRFYSEKTTGQYLLNRGYWHLGEFQLYEATLSGNETVADKMGEVFTNMQAAVNKSNVELEAEVPAISVETYNELQAAYEVFIPLYNELKENGSEGEGGDSIPTTPQVTDGYYLIQTAPFFIYTEEQTDPETGEVWLIETMCSKGMRASAVDGGIYGAWDNYDATAADRAAFLWKVTTKSDGEYELRNMGYEVNAAYLTAEFPYDLVLNEDESTVVFDNNSYVDDDANAYYNIRFVNDPEGDLRYFHCEYHNNGAGTNGRIVGWAAGNGGEPTASEWKLVPVSEEEAKAMIAEFAPVKDAAARLASAQEILADVEPKLAKAQESNSFTFGQAQITDVSQLSSPYTATTEGSLAELIDGDASTYWHSDWSGGTLESGIHYLQVELVNNIEAAAFTFTRRSTPNDHITEWSVYGTNDPEAEKDACALLTTIHTSFGSNNETLMSSAFLVGDYRYLRFYAEDTYVTEDSGNETRGYWHLAEFQLYEATLLGNETIADKMGEVFTNMQAAVDKAKAEANTISVETFNELQAAYEAFIPLYNELGGNAGGEPVVPAPVFRVEDVTAQMGETFVLPIAMQNSQDITAFQFDIYLPYGVTFVEDTNEDGDTEYVVELAEDRATASHTLVANVMADGGMRVTAYSSSSTPFRNNAGDFVYIMLQASSDMWTGTDQIQFSNIRLIEPDATEHVTEEYWSLLTIEERVLPGDVTGDGLVTMADVVATVNHVLEKNSANFIFRAADINQDGMVTMADVVSIVNLVLSDASATATRAAYSTTADNVALAPAKAGGNAFAVALNNTQAYSAFQMDVVLPQGSSLASVALSARAGRSHTLAWQQLSADKVRVVAYSPDNATFSGNMGELVTLNVNGATRGVCVENTRFVTPEGVEEVLGSEADMLNDALAQMQVSVSGNALCVHSPQACRLSVYSIDGKLVKKLDVQCGSNRYTGFAAGAYIVNGVKFVIK